MKRLMERVPAVAVSAAMVAMSGCTVGPDYSRPGMKAPGAYGEPGALASTTVPASTRPAGPMSRITTRPVQVTQWWSTFGDPQLDSLIDRAMRANLDLRQAESRIRAARAQRTISGASDYPTLNSGGGYNTERGSKNITIPLGAFGGGGGSGGTSAKAGGRARTPEQDRSGPPVSAALQSPFGGGGFPGAETSLYQAGFDAAWELDVFGGIRRDIEAAGADYEASVEDRRDAMVTLLAEVARDYITLRGLQRQSSIAEENLRSQQESLGLTRERFEKGFTTELDVARAQAEVAATAASLPALQIATRQAMHRIAVMLASPPQALIEELSRPSPIPVVPPEVPVGLPSDLLRRRPDIRRAERQLAAATRGSAWRPPTCSPSSASRARSGLTPLSPGTWWTGAAAIS